MSQNPSAPDNSTKVYTLPVSWSVCSTIDVEAESLQQAIEIAKSRIDDIPCSSDSEYVDGSYAIDDCDPNIDYRRMSNITINKDGTISKS